MESDRVKSLARVVAASTVALTLAAGIGLAGTSSAFASTYDLGDATLIGWISATSNVNDPFPSNLICLQATDVCNTKQDGYQPNYWGDNDIDSVALWKSGEPDDSVITASTTGDDALSGTVTVTYQAGDLLAAYAVVKASGEFGVFSVALGGLPALLISGDMYTFNWNTSGQTTHGMSHVALYDSVAAVPLPATLPLLFGGLGLLGLVGLRRKSAAV